uniref:L1 transposable element RRM domain-containing protein n=1 Tax=Oryzias melastigma TaxID=30732 RepID=A0A3B3BMK6_ORYME
LNKGKTKNPQTYVWSKLREKPEKTEENELLLASAANEQAVAEELADSLSSCSESEANLTVKAIPTTADLMHAITTFRATVDNKFTELSSKITAMQTTLATVTGKVCEMEDVLNDQGERITALESLCKELLKNQDLHHKKLDDLVSRSRRHTIRILGIAEGTEKGRPQDFITDLIPSILGKDNFASGVLVDCAHRAPRPKPAVGGRPRPFIVRLLYCQTRDLIVRLAAQTGTIQFNQAKVYIFPDLSPDVLALRRRFEDVCKRCRAANLHFGFLHRARFRVTLNGETSTFDKPEEAMKFIDRDLSKDASFFQRFIYFKNRIE